MSKLKQPWVKTAIPKVLKIELFRIMRDNSTQKAREIAVVNSEVIEALEKRLKLETPMSRDTFKRLTNEIMELPYSEVLSLPKDLQDWIIEIRPDLKQDIERHLTKSSESSSTSSFTPIVIPKRKIKRHIKEIKTVDGKVQETDWIELH